MKDEEFHPIVQVTIASDAPSNPVWRYKLYNATDTELRDLASLIRTCVENYRSTIER